MDTTLYQGAIISFILAILLWYLLKFVNAVKYPPILKTFLFKDWLIALLITSLIFLFNHITFGTKISPQDILQVLIVTIVAAPIVEEIFFRRIIFEYLLQNAGRKFSLRLMLSAFFVAGTISIALFFLGAPAVYFMIVLLLISLLFFNIIKKYRTYYAVLSQAIFFGLLHYPGLSWTLLCSGLLYGGIYLWKRNILLTIVSHSVMNLLIFSVSHTFMNY
jgi:membrane protease YdiL (CAAX protease family)